jgi:transcriptional regulator with XRE-family HTH domain
MKNLYDVIQKQRIQQSLSLRKLSSISGVGFATIHQAEIGNRNLSIEQADRILKALGVSFVIGKE